MSARPAYLRHPHLHGDLQLDRAIEEALQRLDAVPAAEAPPLPAPKVRLAS